MQHPGTVQSQRRHDLEHGPPFRRGTRTTGLASSPGGTSHTFVWASGSDVSNANNSNVEIRITPIDTGGAGTAGTTSTFTVNNLMSTPGVYDPTTSTFRLKNSLSGGTADEKFVFGPPSSGWIPLVGDWTGDGTDTPGLY